MGERNNTVVCCFDPRRHSINAFQIHEWIYECLQIPEDNIRMIQTDRAKIHAYIKFTEEESKLQEDKRSSNKTMEKLLG